jgi:hypothetical protein
MPCSILPPFILQSILPSLLSTSPTQPGIPSHSLPSL